MNSEPILIEASQPSVNDARLRLLIELLGLRCKVIEVSTLDKELARAADHELCILANSTTMARWLQTCSNPEAAIHKLRQKGCALFSYGFSPENCGASVASALSDGAICDVQSFTRPDLRYDVSSSHPEITGEFSGLSFGSVRNDIDSRFVCSGDSRTVVPLISIAGMPLWAFIEKDGCRTFMLACSAAADLQQEISQNVDVAACFSQLLPATMFLKRAFGSRCWHSEHRFANFIIDDPPLQRSYGYLNYKDLVSIMDEKNFATTLAFIPWNYRRTEKAVAQLFRERADRLSLCVHGCDHTASEFGTADLAVLNSKVQLASTRMDDLSRTSGVSHSKVMVCPQGVFSPQALTALKCNNYLAALNSSASPAHLPLDEGPPVLSDYLFPAVTRYGGVPLFLRRHPRGVEQFAFDLFFGKPALIIEHQAYLKDGGTKLGDFVRQLNSIARLQWSGLHEIFTKSYLQRDETEDCTVCKLFTNQHVIENHAEHERRFMITKAEGQDVRIQRVLVNGQVTPFDVADGALRFEIPIPAHSSAVANILYENVLPYAEPQQAFAIRTRIWSRRMLCEFRDKVLSRNEFLLASAQALHRRLFVRRKSDAPPRAAEPEECIDLREPSVHRSPGI